MPRTTGKEQAAFIEIASVLGPMVTNDIIVQVADALGVDADASSKDKRIRLALSHLWEDGRRHGQIEVFVLTLAMEGYARSKWKRSPKSAAL
jgi:hypothetical protein